MGMKKLVTLFSVVGVLVLAGCVSEKIEPEYRPQLGMSQGSDGLLTLMLQTRQGYTYTILYEDPQSRAWTPLKGYESIKGTGELIEIRKKIDPRRPVPRMTVDYSIP
jgi:hypothetical protein